MSLSKFILAALVVCPLSVFAAKALTGAEINRGQIQSVCVRGYAFAWTGSPQSPPVQIWEQAHLRGVGEFMRPLKCE